MKLLLLPLLVFIYSLLGGQWTDWQEAGKTACGPVLIKLGEKPDSTVNGAYEIKIDGTPGASCVVVVRTYFMTVSGKKVYDEVALNSGFQWQGKGQVEADSLIGFMRTEIVSASGCSCAENAAKPNVETPVSKQAPALLSESPPDSAAADVWAEKAPLPQPASPGNAVVESAGPANVAPGAPPVPASPVPDSSAAGARAGVSSLPERTAPDSAAAIVPGAGSSVNEAIAASLVQAPDSGAADPWAEKPLLEKEKNNMAVLVPDTTAQPPVAVPDTADAWAEAPRSFPENEKSAVTNPETATPDTALTESWSAATAGWGIAPDSAAVDAEVAANAGEELELKVLSAAELDSIRIYNDPFILEGLNTIANASVKIENDKVTRSIVATAREELDLLEEKQVIFMEKYTKLVKTGNYGMSYCNACFGNPIIHHADNYPPYEACGECKGGGYKLTYHGKAKPNTIEHLYYAELLPAPDYRKPTLKRVAENPADFEYDNGVFKTEADELSARKRPYFFVCMYYKGDENTPNRMFITEIINKKEHDEFAGAGKDGIKLLLEPYMPETVKRPDEMYIWEFNSFEDAYNRSIIPLHRAGVVGFEVEIIKYEPSISKDSQSPRE